MTCADGGASGPSGAPRPADFGRAALRMVHAMAERVGASDIAEFGLMWEIMHEAEHAVTAADRRAARQGVLLDRDRR